MLEALLDTLGIMYCTISAYCSKILSFGVLSDEINFKPLNNKLFILENIYLNNYNLCNFQPVLTMLRY